MAYYHFATLRFECTQCGACCTGNSNHYVALNQREAREICHYLGITDKWFKQRYVTKRDGLYIGIKMEKAGHCPFLNDNGRCDIYPVRPTQCRTYPYWPELVHNKSTWFAEKKRCEGIDRGSTISKQHITAMLKKQELADEEDALD